MIVGVMTGALTVIVLAIVGRMSPPLALLPTLAGAAAGVGYEARLAVRVATRRGRLTDELPTTLEFLALCLSAGEGFLDSVRRVAAVGSGELTVEFRLLVLAVGTGEPFADALGEMTRRLQLPGLTGAVDQVVAALEHGAPLSAVLHAQAGDSREDAKRVLIEQAGRKEILMLLPLVFLILPLSVLLTKVKLGGCTCVGKPSIMSLRCSRNFATRRDTPRMRFHRKSDVRDRSCCAACGWIALRGFPAADSRGSGRRSERGSCRRNGGEPVL